jgi:hypothetical protein
MVKWKERYVKITLSGKSKLKGLDPYWMVVVKHA